MEIKDWAPAVSWLLVLVGWFRLTNENNKRQLRKEVKERIDEIQELLNAIEDDSYEYYSLPQGPEAERLALRLKTKVSSVGHHLNVLSGIDAKYSCSGLLIRLRRSVTGGAFESVERVPILLSDPIFQSISSSVVEISRAIDRAYASKVS